MHVGCGGNRNPAGDSGEEPGPLVVGVVGRRGECRTVKRRDKIGKRGIEGVGQGHIVCRIGGDRAVIEQSKGVSQRSVFTHGHGRDILADCKACRRVRRDGLGCRDGGRDTRRGERRRIDGAGTRAERCEFVRLRLIDKKQIATRRDRETAEDERRTRSDRRVGGGDPVEKRAGRSRHIGEGNERARTEGVSAEIVGQRRTVDGGGPAVDDGEDVGDPLARTIRARERGLRHGERADDLARRDVGVDDVSAVGELSLIREGCHKTLLVFSFLGEKIPPPSVYEKRKIPLSRFTS